MHAQSDIQGMGGATISTKLNFLNFTLQQMATARGFEPLRAEPNGFLVHHLNHSVTLSMSFVLLGMAYVETLRRQRKGGK